MGNINGILQMSNDKKDLLIKLEDIINIPDNSNIKIEIPDYPEDCSIIRMNGIKLSDNDIAVYRNISSAIVSLSLDNYKIPDDTDYVNFNLEITVNN